jgi:hypothetical protein
MMYSFADLMSSIFYFDVCERLWLFAVEIVWGRGNGIEIPAKGGSRATKSAAADWVRGPSVACSIHPYGHMIEGD